MFKKVVIAFTLTLAISLLAAPSIASANGLHVTTSDDESESYYLTADDLQSVDIGIAYSRYDSLPISFFCDALDSGEEIDDDIMIDVYLKKPGAKFKKVKSLDIFDVEEGHTDSQGNYFGSNLDGENDEVDYEYSFKIKGLKPYTKYSVRVVCTIADSKLTKTVTKTFRTAHKPLAKKEVSKSGTTYKWKRVKGASGYLVHYRKAVSLGKNEYGTRMYEWRYAAKAVSKNTIKLGSNIELIKVMPFKKTGGYYYAHMLNPTKSKAKMQKAFKAVSETYYY